MNPESPNLWYWLYLRGAVKESEVLRVLRLRWGFDFRGNFYIKNQYQAHFLRLNCSISKEQGHFCDPFLRSRGTFIDQGLFHFYLVRFFMLAVIISDLGGAFFDHDDFLTPSKIKDFRSHFSFFSRSISLFNQNSL